MNEMEQLKRRVAELENKLNYLNFSSIQIQNKSIEVNGGIIFKRYASNPANPRDGQISYVNGTFKGYNGSWVNLH